MTVDRPYRDTTDPISAELLQSVVDVAQAIFGAAASSVFTLDDDADELVFQAVAGKGQDFLVGRGFPAGRGIAGWVAATGESMVVDDLEGHAVFDRELAASTRYVPNSIMAAPLLHHGRVLGVLEVLDPSPQSRCSLSELDLLSLFARQAAVSLQIVADRRRAATQSPSEPQDSRNAALDLVATLQRLLLSPPAPGRPTTAGGGS
jgi:GAF domain-containing protein